MEDLMIVYGKSTTEERMLPMFTEEEKHASLSEEMRVFTDIERRSYRDDSGVGV